MKRSPRIVSSLPFEIREAVVEVCGKAFNYKGPLKDLLAIAGVPQEMLAQYADEPKFKMVRNILGDLDARGEEGWRIQRRLVTELCKLKRVPDESVVDKDRALASLRTLKEMATEHQFMVNEERARVAYGREERSRATQLVLQRGQKLTDLKTAFARMLASPNDPQERGYGLENLLVDLFALNEVEYHPSYKTATQQIDGAFEYKGFHYLVEARWRKEMPRDADLAVLKHKVETKLDSTRGLFVSVIGFRPEVIAEFTKGVSSNLILLSGEDLTWILEDRVLLRDALDYKIDQASRLGVIYARLSQFPGKVKAR